MSHDSITRQLTIAAPPETVYAVVSEPSHIREWWSDDADLSPTAGANGTITFGDPADPAAAVVSVTVVEADPPRRFAFRWAHPTGEAPTTANSFLVTFDLERQGEGTLLRFQETGFLDHGDEPAVAEATYADHASAWERFLPQLVAHASGVAAS